MNSTQLAFSFGGVISSPPICYRQYIAVMGCFYYFELISKHTTKLVVGNAAHAAYVSDNIAVPKLVSCAITLFALNFVHFTGKGLK